MDEVTVGTQAHPDPLVARTSFILKDRIQRRCSTRVIEGEREAHIMLTVDGHLPHEAFRIEDVGTAVRIAGGSPRGLLYGVGKFLRTSRYHGTHAPSPWRGTSAPRGSLRGMYFATHFHNWYHVAPEAEIVRYTRQQRVSQNIAGSLAPRPGALPENENHPFHLAVRHPVRGRVARLDGVPGQGEPVARLHPERSRNHRFHFIGIGSPKSEPNRSPGDNDALTSWSMML